MLSTVIENNATDESRIRFGAMLHLHDFHHVQIERRRNDDERLLEYRHCRSVVLFAVKSVQWESMLADLPAWKSSVDRELTEPLSWPTRSLRQRYEDEVPASRDDRSCSAPPLRKTMDVVPSPVISSWAVAARAINAAVGCCTYHTGRSSQLLRCKKHEVMNPHFMQKGIAVLGDFDVVRT